MKTVEADVHFKGLGDGADCAVTHVLHGLPPLQLSVDPPPVALQVQASVKLSGTQGNTKQHKQTNVEYQRLK